MKVFSYNDKNYNVDDDDFLCDYEKWDEDFANGLSLKLNIISGLSDKHWEVINYIREQFKKTGDCPLVYQTCKANGLSTKSFKLLFPTGYLRGACKLAGITYRDRIINYYGESVHFDEITTEERAKQEQIKKKVYRVDIFGFLVDPNEWDETYAVYKAAELKMTRGLTEKHWNIIKYLRNIFEKEKKIPNVFNCCDDNEIEIEDMEKLFPDGYHRGALKIAGLRVA